MKVEKIAIVIMMNHVRGLKAGFFVVYFLLLLTTIYVLFSCNDNEIRKRSFFMEHLNIKFEPANKNINISILDPDSVEDYVNSHGGNLNDVLSARFKSKVFDVDGGKLLELRKYGTNEDAKLYRSLNDLLFCRKVFTTRRHDTKERIYDVNCTKEDVDFLVKQYDGKGVPELKEDTRAAIKLNNGQYLIIYRAGDGVLFNSLSDLQYISPFESLDYDDIEDIFINRKVNLYADANHSFNAEIISSDSIKNYKQTSEKTKFGTAKILSDGRILEKISNDAFCILKSKEDFEKMSQVRKLHKSASSLLIDKHEDGLVVNIDEFKHNIESAKDSLSKKLGIYSNKLDFTTESLNILDAAINKYLCDDYFVSEIAPYAVSYIGEIIKRNTKGTWKFERYKSTPFYRAIIEPANGNEIDFISAVFSEFRNQIETGDFASYAVVSSMVIGAK